MLIYTVAANVPNEDALGLKERIAMDLERYGDCKVVKILVEKPREHEQLRIK